jgi:hypothetical protein
MEYCKSIIWNLAITPGFLIAFIILALRVAHSFGTSTLKSYWANGFALQLQESVLAINLVFLFEKIVNFYQPMYVFIVALGQIILYSFSLGVFYKLSKRKRNKRILIVSAYVLSMISILILFLTMRTYIFMVKQ